jgi:hypothetical protein
MDRNSKIEVTHTLLQNLSEKLDVYIEKDEKRFDEFSQFRLESSKHLSEVAVILDDIKKKVDMAVNTTIPAMKENQSRTESTLKTYGWLLKAIIGATIIASLGGVVGGVNSCYSATAMAESSHVSIESSDADLYEDIDGQDN